VADETPPATSPFAGLDRALLRETKKAPTPGKGTTGRQTGRLASGAPRRTRQRPAPPTTPTRKASPLASTNASVEDITQDSIGASNQDSKGRGEQGDGDDVVQRRETTSTAGVAWDTAMIESLRKAVKPLGDKVSYVRLTDAEKDGLREVVVALSRQGLKTTENEVSRIAIAYLLSDHAKNGPDSVVTRVIEALLS